jgi:hypothetical protein
LITRSSEHYRQKAAEGKIATSLSHHTMKFSVVHPGMNIFQPIRTGFGGRKPRSIHARFNPKRQKHQKEK